MVLISTFMVLGALTALVLSFGSGLMTYWYDFWKLFVVFLGCYVCYNLIYVVAAFIVTLFVNLNRHVERPNRFFAWNSAEFAHLLCIYCNVQAHVTGEEKIPADSRFLMVSNHRSNLDPIVVMDKLRKHGIAFISKASNLKIPIVGKFVHECCFLSIDRENPRNALKTINEAADYIKDDVTSFGIYPEGTRSKSDKLLPFHAGSLKIAQKAGVPIVVATISGTEQAAHRFPRETDVYLDIVDVISAEEVKSSKTVDMTEKVQGIISDHLFQRRAM